MADYSEQGTPIAGYEEKGPYHCGDCVHRTTPDSDLCMHPAVAADPAMKSRVQRVGNQLVTKVNLAHGCCKYVLQKKQDND